LVTGANGFVGSHLVEALVTRGDEVTCLVRETSRLERLEPYDVRICNGDVTNPDSLKSAIIGRDVVYHVAGVAASVGKKRVYEVNGQGVHHVADACASVTTPPVLVVVSSLAAVGPAKQGEPRTEGDSVEPVSHYGRSKLAGERAAAAFAGRIPATIIRPPIVVGESDRLAFELFRMIWRYRLHMMVGLGRARYSVVHASDLARLLILAAERGRRLRSVEEDDTTRQGYYFAAGDQAPTYAELGRLVASALDRRVILVPSLPRAIWPVAAILGLWGRLRRHPGLLDIDKAREARAGSWICSAQRAVDELDYSVAATLPKRLRQTAEWYRRKNWL
jgi:nucleoside-diphosphate-sugar epimerase